MELPMPHTRKLERETIAAWVVKASPDIFDVEAAIADGAVPFESWRLAPSYRVALVAVGDAVVLWVSGPDAGILAAGTVTGRPYVTQGGTRYWVDVEEKAKLRPYLPVELVPIHKIGRRELMSDARFHDAEVVRAPQMSNPSYLTQDELEVVRDLMGVLTVREVGWPK
jgi:EVE domain